MIFNVNGNTNTNIDSEWVDITEECALSARVSVDNTKVYKNENTLVVLLQATMSEEVQAKTNEVVFGIPEEYAPNLDSLVFSATTFQVGGQHLRVVVRGKLTNTEVNAIGDITVSGDATWKNVCGTLVIPIIK